MLIHIAGSVFLVSNEADNAYSKKNISPLVNTHTVPSELGLCCGTLNTLQIQITRISAVPQCLSGRRPQRCPSVGRKAAKMFETNGNNYLDLTLNHIL